MARGWDLADDLPEGVTAEDLGVMISEAVPVDVVADEHPTENADPLESLNQLPEKPTLRAVTEALKVFATLSSLTFEARCGNHP